MGQSKVKGYGSRGWILIIWIATAFLSYLVIGNYPLNILSDLYGGQAVLSSIYTAASIIFDLFDHHFILRLSIVIQ